MSPNTPWIRWPRSPTIPASTGPLLSPTRNCGQSGCVGADRLRAPLQLERGARGVQRVVGLVAALVEDGEDLIADEVLHLAAEPLGDHRRQLAPVGEQHRVHVLGPARLRERREAREVGEQQRHVAPARQRLVEVERAEALLVPLRPRGGGDRREADRHQHVPLPPAQLPAGRQRRDHDDQRLGQQRERDRHREREPRAAPPPDAEVRERRVAVHRDADRGQDRQRQLDLLGGDAVAQRRQPGAGDRSPRRRSRRARARSASASGARSAATSRAGTRPPTRPRRRPRRPARAASRARTRRSPRRPARSASRSRAARGSRR